MKPLFFILALLISATSYSQNIVGKWKPTYFTMDTLFKGDMKADTFWLNKPALKAMIANDKDPESSEMMMSVMFEAMFRALKSMTEEYAADGKYAETNTIVNKTKTGTYTFDKAKNILIKKLEISPNDQVFTVSWKGEQLVLTTELNSSNGKKGKMEIIYQKL